MQSSYPESIAQVLTHEGGYVNHPRDPGGATNQGITQATYNAYRNSMGDSTRSVRDITGGEVRTIYKRLYWNKVKGSFLPAGVDHVVMDAGVNSGPKRAAKWLQRAVGTTTDGMIGTATLLACKKDNAVRDIKRVCAYRLSFMQRLKIWSTFGRGWSRRVAETEALGVALAIRDGSVSEDELVLSEQEAKASKDASGKGAGGAAAGGAGGSIGIDSLSTDLWATGIAIGLVVLCVAVIAYLIHRRQVSSAKEKAYARQMVLVQPDNHRGSNNSVVRDAEDI